MLRQDTIVAIATPAGTGGIGVVRLSGPDALATSLQIFQQTNKKNQKSITTRKPVYGTVIDPENKQVLDHCLLTWFKGPSSYTGEDVVELSCHGSRPVLKRLVDILIEKNARPAGPGEFTFRAVINGRIDLAQAEAVNRLIRADTLFQAEQAVRQLEGSVSQAVHGYEERLLNLIARMEAEVDFAEENENFLVRDKTKVELADLSSDLQHLVEGFEAAKLIRDGAVIVLAGRSNVGKSTLFNAILKQERAIVDAQPGTTRDYIAETIVLDGLPVTIIDTAGLRKGGEAVEKEGMRRTEKQILEADLVLLVTVSGEDLREEESRIIKKLAEENVPCMTVKNKIDAFPHISQKDDIEENCYISALKNDGVENLVGLCKVKLGFNELRTEQDLVTEKRQQQLFRVILEKVQSASTLFAEGAYDEVVLEELNIAMRSLSEITGRGGTEEILSRIFSSFCIGK